MFIIIDITHIYLFSMIYFSIQRKFAVKKIRFNLWRRILSKYANEQTARIHNTDDRRWVSSISVSNSSSLEAKYLVRDMRHRLVGIALTFENIHAIKHRDITPRCRCEYRIPTLLSVRNVGEEVAFARRFWANRYILECAASNLNSDGWMIDENPTFNLVKFIH